jgi:hypothetical protein
MPEVLSTVPEIIVVDEKEKKKIYSIPEHSRFPSFLIEYPVIDSGIRHLVVEEKDKIKKRAFRSKDILSVVENPLSPKAFKLLHLLIAQKQQSVYLVARDVAQIVGDTYRKNTWRDFDKIISMLKRICINYVFYKKSVIPRGLENFVTREEKVEVERLEGMGIVSTVATGIRKRGKMRTMKVNFTQEFWSLVEKQQKYVTLKTSVLQQLSSKNSTELLIYLLCLRPQRINLKEFLIPYLLGVSENALLKVRDRKRIEVARVQTHRIFKNSISALEKMKDLGVIDDFKYEVTRIEIGGTGSAPFFSRLELKKSPSEKSKGGRSYE